MRCGNQVECVDPQWKMPHMLAAAEDEVAGPRGAETRDSDADWVFSARSAMSGARLRMVELSHCWTMCERTMCP